MAESVNMLGRHKPDDKSHRLKGSAPIVRSCTGLHSNEGSWRKSAHSIKQFLPWNFSVRGDRTVLHPDTDLKNVFGEVNANDFNRIHEMFSRNSVHRKKRWHYLLLKKGTSITSLQFSGQATVAPLGHMLLFLFGGVSVTAHDGVSKWKIRSRSVQEPDGRNKVRSPDAYTATKGREWATLKRKKPEDHGDLSDFFSHYIKELLRCPLSFFWKLSILPMFEYLKWCSLKKMFLLIITSKSK